MADLEKFHSEHPELFNDLKIVARAITSHNPGLWEDAYGIMVVAVLERVAINQDSNVEPTMEYYKRKAIWVAIDKLYRSSQYKFYWNYDRIKRLPVDIGNLNIQVGDPNTEALVDSTLEERIISALFWGDILDIFCEDDRIIIVCYYWGDMTDAEIGAILNLPTRVTSYRRIRILSELKRCLLTFMGWPMYILKVETTFAAAHSIDDHEGDCSNLHGHTWKVIVELGCHELVNDMVLDFRTIKKALKAVLPDHKHLNNVYKFSPTAENLAKHFYERLSFQIKGVPRICWLEAVTVYESESCSVRYTEGRPGATQ